MDAFPYLQRGHAQRETAGPSHQCVYGLRQALAQVLGLRHQAVTNQPRTQHEHCQCQHHSECRCQLALQVQVALQRRRHGLQGHGDDDSAKHQHQHIRQPPGQQAQHDEQRCRRQYTRERIFYSGGGGFDCHDWSVGVRVGAG